MSNNCKCSTCPPLPPCLGSFDPCGTLSTGIDALSTGDYVLKVNYLGAVIEIEAAQTELEEIEFPLSGLNEDFTFEAKIIDPDGDSLGVIRFSTSKAYSI